jgi:hypothetical protein
MQLLLALRDAASATKAVTLAMLDHFSARRTELQPGFGVDRQGRPLSFFAIPRVCERISAMTHQDVKADIRVILEDPDMTDAEKIDRLERMRESARAEMRAATESAMVNDDDVGDDLKQLDEALARLSADPVSPEDGGGATL